MRHLFSFKEPPSKKIRQIKPIDRSVSGPVPKSRPQATPVLGWSEGTETPMAAERQAARVFRFGTFEADLGNRQLFRNGISVSLSGQPFEVLALLLEHHGQLVTREQLRARLWPSGTVVEFDHSIGVAITKLREALGDDAQQPRFIATVPRHGYRIIAPVTTPADAALATGPASAPTPPALVYRIRRLLSGEALTVNRGTGVTSEHASARLNRLLFVAIAVGMLGAAAYFAVNTVRAPKPPSPTGVATSANATPPTFNPSPHSIAVLPFVNMSGDKEQEYFSDGMTEELITALSQVHALKVTARTSAFTFKGRNVDAGTIARTLNVASILEGSVRRAGQRARITVQLINGRDGFRVWSQEYDRDIKNIFELQSDIATAVALKLRLTVLNEELTRIQTGGTQNPEAYDAFLRSEDLDGSGEGSHGMDLLETAVRLDPQFANAWDSLALLYGFKARDYAGAASQSWLARARTAAEHAVELAPQLPKTHQILALVAGEQLDWTTDNREVTAAEKINPDDSLTLISRANLNAVLGHWSEAEAAFRTALDRDPLDGASLWDLAGCLSAMGRHREAEQIFRRVIALDRGSAEAAHGAIANEILLDGRPAEALAEAKLEPDEKTRESSLARIYYALGRRQDADRLLASYIRKHSANDAFDIAWIYAYRGETDQALRWLDRAVKQNDPALPVIKGVMATLPNIRNDPRYSDVLKRIGLPVS